MITLPSKNLKPSREDAKEGEPGTIVPVAFSGDYRPRLAGSIGLA